MYKKVPNLKGIWLEFLDMSVQSGVTYTQDTLLQYMWTTILKYTCNTPLYVHHDCVMLTLSCCKANFHFNSTVSSSQIFETISVTKSLKIKLPAYKLIRRVVEKEPLDFK